MTLSSPSVTRVAISMMVSRSGSSPVISRSIQTIFVNFGGIGGDIVFNLRGWRRKRKCESEFTQGDPLHYVVGLDVGDERGAPGIGENCTRHVELYACVRPIDVPTCHIR